MKTQPRKVRDTGRVKDLISTLVLIGAILILLTSHYAMRYIAFKQHGHNVTDWETVSIATRPAVKVYVTIEGQRFLPGSKITSNENGDFILWDSTMPKSWIIGVVTDSGTIDYSPFEIKPE